MTNEQMQEAIDAAVAKGFMPLDTESIEYNYNMALEFEKLDPDQQQALGKATGALPTIDNQA